MPTCNEETIVIPDTLANWPWPRSLNPHYETVSAASLDWLWSFQIFPPKAQLAFKKCDYGKHHVKDAGIISDTDFEGLLAGMAYPNHSKGTSIQMAQDG